MHERAVSFGGKLEVRSKIGAGTAVNLQVPGKISYCQPRWSRWPAKHSSEH
jgi:hypothetical protein